MAGNTMEQAAEWYAVLTCVVIGLSHLTRPQAWVEVFAALHRLGQPGAFANAAMNLVQGAAFVATHRVGTGPTVVLTLLGYLLLLKGTLYFLFPDVALRSMAKAGSGNGREFIIGGILLLAIAGVIGYGLWS